MYADSDLVFFSFVPWQIMSTQKMRYHMHPTDGLRTSEE